MLPTIGLETETVWATARSADGGVGLFTTWASGAEILDLNAISPPYEPVIVWPPAESVPVMNSATPEPFRELVPSTVWPSRNVTVPLGVLGPLTPATVAVNVTDWPRVDGFTDEERVVVVAVSGAVA